MRVITPIVALALLAASCGGTADPATSGASSPTATADPPGGTTADPRAGVTTTSFLLPDVSPPPLTIIDPFPDAQLDVGQYVFSGRSEPGITLVANGTLEVVASQDGLWSVPIDLVPGPNTVTFTATDAAGNTTTQQITVFYAPTPDGPCGEVPNTLLPIDPLDATMIEGDLDADGEDDVATVYRTDEWRFHIGLTYGWGTETTLTPYIGAALPPAEAVALVDLGAPVVAVLLGASQVGATYALFGLDECVLRVAELSTGEIPPLLAAENETGTSWFACRQRGITQFTASVSPDDAGLIRIRQTDYTFDPATFRLALAADADDGVAGDLDAVVRRLRAGNPACVP